MRRLIALAVSAFLAWGLKLSGLVSPLVAAVLWTAAAFLGIWLVITWEPISNRLFNIVGAKTKMAEYAVLAICGAAAGAITFPGGYLVYQHMLKPQEASTAALTVHQNEILETLSSFRGEALNAQGRCEISSEDAEQLHAEYLTWERRVALYLQENLGSSAHGFFADPNGIPAPPAHLFPSQLHGQVWFWFHLRLVRVAALIEDPKWIANAKTPSNSGTRTAQTQ